MEEHRIPQGNGRWIKPSRCRLGVKETRKQAQRFTCTCGHTPGSPHPFLTVAAPTTFRMRKHTRQQQWEGKWSEETEKKWAEVEEHENDREPYGEEEELELTVEPTAAGLPGFNVFPSDVSRLTLEYLDYKDHAKIVRLARNSPLQAMIDRLPSSPCLRWRCFVTRETREEALLGIGVSVERYSCSRGNDLVRGSDGVYKFVQRRELSVTPLKSMRSDFDILSYHGGFLDLKVRNGV